MPHASSPLLALATFSLLLLAPLPVCAEQQQPSIGLRHLTPKPAAAAETPVAPASTAATSPTEAPAPRLEYKEITIEEALIKTEDLKAWASLNLAATAHGAKDVEKLVHLVESDRGAVPPVGLFLTAKALSDEGKMELAAMYLFVGQLRLNFDVTRWPARANEEDVKRLTQDKNKTQDQAAPTLGAEPRINNPHQGISKLSESIGQPIIEWVVKNPAHFGDIMNRVRIWDASAPYAYDPGYDLPQAIAFEEWSRILMKVRTNYFERMTLLLNSVEKTRGQ